MYFASEPCNTLAVSRELLQRIRERPELTWLALVDSAFDFGESGIALSHARHFLYDSDELSDLLAASPFLIVLTSNDEKQLRFELAALIRHRRERPMLSFIGTSSTARAVNENFQLYCNATTDDDQELILRFADTRVLPVLPDALRPAYWSGMTSLLSAWIAIDRDGLLRSLPVNEYRPQLQGRFQLSPAEFEKLVTQSEPDAVLDVIAETNLEALPEKDRAETYRKVADACFLAQKHKVNAFPDVVALAYLALLNDGKWIKSEKLSEMLSRFEWVPGQLIDRLADFIE